MSADNWRTCPRCMEKTIEEKQIIEKQAKESYGKVSELQYVENLEKAQKDIDPGETLREDYELGIKDDGTFTVGYRAHCDRCGFIYEFEHTEKVTI